MRVITESTSKRTFKFNPRYSRKWIRHYSGETWYRFKNSNKYTNGIGDRENITAGPLKEFKEISDTQIRDYLYLAAYHKICYEKESDPKEKQDHLDKYYTYIEKAQTIGNNLVIATN